MSKVFFDGAERLIIVQPEIVELNFQEDVFSPWKDWFLEDTNSRFGIGLTTTGGKDSVVVPSGEKGITFFLDEGWRIRPFEGSHRLLIFGNVYTVDGEDPFVETLGYFKVTIAMTVSNIISSAGGSVSSDELEGIGGDEWTVTLA